MVSIEKLRELQDEMKKCFRCSLCKMVPLPVVRDPRYSDCCPASKLYHFHGYSGSGKSIMALSLLDGRIPVDENLSRFTFACTACGYCDVACKFIMDAERHAVNMALREHIVEEGLGPETHSSTVQTMEANGSRPFGGLSKGSNTVPGLKNIPSQQAKVLLYGGTQAEDGDAARVVEKLAKLLTHAGQDVGVLEIEPQSGVYAYWTGHDKAFTAMAKKTADVLDNAGAKTIVVTSGADLGMFRAKYPEYASAPETTIMHATELLAQLIKKGKLRLPASVTRKVTYHDPCYLGRQSEPPVHWEGETKVSHGCMTYTDPPRPVNRGGAGVFDAPRNILAAVNGLEFVEMFRIREYSFCCGGGGGAPDAYPELARFAASHRQSEARDVGVQAIVTACHHCRKNLSVNAGGDHIDALPVLDIIDIVYEAAGLS